METQDIDNDILVMQTRLRVELDPNKKIELNKQLRKLQLQKEIEAIKIRIAQLS